jgi:hypothetical protein
MKRLRLDNKNTVKDILSFLNDTAREMERERKEATTPDTYGWIDTMLWHITLQSSRESIRFCLMIIPFVLRKGWTDARKPRLHQ